jgi:hypothetical protein
MRSFLARWWSAVDERVEDGILALIVVATAMKLDWNPVLALAVWFGSILAVVTVYMAGAALSEHRRGGGSDG